MNKGTIIIEYIDNENILKGFDDPVIDPIETRNVVYPLLLDTDIYKEIMVKQSEMKNIRDSINKSFNAAGRAMERKDDHEIDLQMGIFQSENTKFKIAMNDLKDMKPALKKEHEKLFNDNAVFCNPKSTEIIKDIQEINLLKNKFIQLNENELLTASGDVILDYRGKIFWEKTNQKWKENTINKIGFDIPENAKLPHQLSEIEKSQISEQFKKEEINKLSESEKNKRKDNEISLALNMAAFERSKLEILEDPNALEKAQNIYNEKLIEINEMYG